MKQYAVKNSPNLARHKLGSYKKIVTHRGGFNCFSLNFGEYQIASLLINR